MPGWQETLNKTGQDLVRGNYFGDRNSKRVASWKKSLDETGQGLLHGLGKKKKTTDDFAQPLNATWRDDPFAGGKRPRISRPFVPNVASSTVHGIPCFELPVPSKQTGPPEASLFDRVKWNKSLRDRKYLKISSPILLVPDDEHQRAPTPVEKDEKYISGTARAPPLRVQVLEFDSQYTVRDISPTYTSFRARDSEAGVPVAPDMRSAARGKPVYSGVTHIPEDLPCHERYVPLVRSRSTRTLERQNMWGGGIEMEEEEDGWSESSSIYSQEDINGDNWDGNRHPR